MYFKLQNNIKRYLIQVYRSCHQEGLSSSRIAFSCQGGDFHFMGSCKSKVMIKFEDYCLL